MWSGATYESPFRLEHALPPAFLTERMALSWQAIFPPATSCRAQRNDRSTRLTKVDPFSRGIRGEDEGDHDIVRCWTELAL